MYIYIKFLIWEKQKRISQVSFLPMNETLHATSRASRASAYHDGRASCVLKVRQERKLAASVVRWGRTRGCRSQDTGCRWPVGPVWSAGHSDTWQIISKHNCICGWAWSRSWLQTRCSGCDKNRMQSSSSICFHQKFILYGARAI